MGRAEAEQRARECVRQFFPRNRLTVFGEQNAIRALVAFETAAIERAAQVAEKCAIEVPFAIGCADGASIASRQIASSIRALAGGEGG